MRPVRLRVLVESGEKHRPTCVYILSMKLKRSRKKNSHITVNILLIIGRTEPRLIRQRCETNWLENGRSAISQRWVAWNSGLWKIAPKSWERKAMFCVWRLLPYFFHLLLPPVRPWDSWLFFFVGVWGRLRCWVKTHLAVSLLDAAPQIFVLEVLREAVEKLFQQIFVGNVRTGFRLQRRIEILNHGSGEVTAGGTRVSLTEFYPTRSELWSFLCRFHCGLIHFLG